MSVSILGLPIQNVSMSEAVADVYGFFGARDSKIVVTPNAEILQMYTTDPAMKEALDRADYIVPDGIGVLMAAKRLGTPLKEKVAGVDLARNLLEKAAKEGGNVFLLGAKPGVAAEAKRCLEEEIPGISIVGEQDGYFKPEEVPAIIERINSLDVDMLFVCLGAPKQEQWMAEHKSALKVGVMLGLGGSLDIFSHTLKRAPKWMIACRIEWLYRVAKEPWRVKRIASLPKFLMSIKK